jgi:hypothetical protein
MSAFSGKQGKGALRRLRDDRYREALERQSAGINAGANARDSCGNLWWYAPLEEFLRPEHRS